MQLQSLACITPYMDLFKRESQGNVFLVLSLTAVYFLYGSNIAVL